MNNLTKKIVFSVIPLLVFIIFLVILEVLFRTIDFPSQKKKDLFDKGATFVPSKNTGFALKTDIHYGLNRVISTKSTANNLGKKISIACFGDSTTFGSGVGQSNSYPAVLQRLFDEKYQDKHISVMNFGVPGFTSEQGKRQFKHQLNVLKPDIAVFAFGFNDGQMAEKSDRDLLGKKSEAYTTVFLNSLRIIKALRLIFPYINKKEKKLNVHRVSLTQYEENLTEMIKLQRKHGGKAIVMNCEFGNNYTHSILKKIVSENKVKFIDFYSIFAEIIKNKSNQLADKLKLEKQLNSYNNETILRVYLPNCNDKPIVLGWSLNKLTENMNFVQCNDNGQPPDERPSDCVWTAKISLVNSDILHYVFFKKEGNMKKCEFKPFNKPKNPLKLWHTRISLPQQKNRFVPINIFGKRILKREIIHPNKDGQKIIAKYLFRLILSSSFY